MIDYTSLLKKITPDAGGEPHTHLRVGTVDVVNADGTLDIEMSSGIIIPDVPKLATAYAPAGAVVQIIGLRGSLLVIGAVGASEAGGAMTKTGSTTAGPSAATTFTSAVNFGVTFPGTPSVAVNLNSAAGATASWHQRAYSVSTTGFTLFGFGPSSTFSTDYQWIAAYAP